MRQFIITLVKAGGESEVEFHQFNVDIYDLMAALRMHKLRIKQIEEVPEDAETRLPMLTEQTFVTMAPYQHDHEIFHPGDGKNYTYGE